MKTLLRGDAHPYLLPYGSSWA